MALEITGNIELDNGLSVDSCYARTSYSMNDDSSKITILVDYWTNQQSYLDKKLNIYPLNNTSGKYEYNREVDGIDVLNFTQIKIKEQLEGLGYSVVITEL